MRRRSVATAVVAAVCLGPAAALATPIDVVVRVEHTDPGAVPDGPPTAPPATPTPPTAPSQPRLARTGAPVLELGFAAAALVATGARVVRTSRRRSS